MKKNLQSLTRQARLFAAFGLLFVFGIAAQAQVTATLDATNPTCGGFTNGSITATGSGGWEPYTFEWNTGATTASIYGLGPGTYTVTVTDMDLGYDVASVTLTSASQVDADISITDVCSGNGNITVPTTGGVAPYTYNWSDGGSGDTRTGLLANTQYCVTVLDANVCGVVTCVVIPAALNLTVTAQSVACNDGCDGSVTANISGGTAPYDVLWDNGVTSTVNGNLPPGTYTVTVTDGNGCSAIASGTIGAPSPIILDAVVDSPPCGNSNMGSATINATGGTPAYIYLWSTGATTQTITGLSEGTYSVTVTDAQGCESETDVIVNPSNQVNIIVNSNNPTCAAPNGGSATATASNGTAPYNYSWNTGATSQTISNLGAGVYTVMVTDANGCTNVASVTLTQEGASIFATTTETDTSCGLNNGSATAMGTGGSGNYTYAWSNGANTQTISNLATGTYTVTVTDVNSGCMAAKTIVIGDSNGVNVSVNTMNAQCSSNNGNAMASPSNGSAPFTYAWSNGGNTQIITGLAGGTYTVTVTDANGCTATASGFVSQIGSDVVVTSTTNQVSCFNGNNGSVGTSVNGGTTPYTFMWSNGATSSVINNLTAGTYNVTVTDANGCTATSSANIIQPSMISVTATSTPAACAGANSGSVTASASGGTPGYAYAWSNGGNTQTVNNLSAGTYTVTVTDVNGCTMSATTTVSQATPITASAGNTPVSCNGGNDGTASVNVFGGTPPYSYAWSNGGNTQTITGLTAGTYNVTITDANGCTATNATTITQGGTIATSTSSTSTACNGGNDGTASANASNGTPPYSYAWSNGGNTQTITGLTAGNYNVTITDANGCTATDVATVTQAGEISIATSTTAVACPGGINGTANANAAGGTAPYSYAWSNGGNGQTITGLTASAYNVTVTDANGCTAVSTANVTVSGTSTLSCSVTVTSPVSENNGSDGVLTANVSGGSGNYSYAWSNGANTQIINNLTPGTYTATVTDNNSGCTSVCSATLNNPPECECDNFTDPGQVCCDQTACGPGYDPAPITSLIAPSGGTGGPIEYIWMMKEGEGPFNQTQVTSIPNTNTPSYDPPVLYTTTTYYRCARRDACCPFIETTGVTIFINEDADASFTGPADNILCQEETHTYTANNISSTATYSWTVQGTAVVTGANTPSIDVVWSSNGFYDVMLTVTDNACTASTIDNRLVTNSPDYCNPGAQGGGAQGLVIDATVIHSANVEIELITEAGSTNEVTYALERSKDGEDFDEVSAIEMNSATYNQTNDLDPMRGRSFYRVRMTNAAGIESYSNTEEITIFIGNENTLIYPNPFRGELNYEILDTFGEDVTLEVIAADGRVVRTYTTDKDTFGQSLNVTDLPAGIYFMRFQFSSLGVQTVKMIKQ